MSDTRVTIINSTQTESKISLDQLYPARSKPIPVPAGAESILGAMLPDEIKRSPAGRVQLGMSNTIGNIMLLTDAIENCQHSIDQGHSSFASGVGAFAGFVAEKALAATAHTLIVGGVGTAEVGVGIPVAACGILLMSRASEAGKLANDYVPILVDDTIDKFSQLKSSVTQFAANAYDKYIKNEALSKHEFNNAEDAMMKLGYLQHLNSQGIYEGLDKNQKLIYNWLARDEFNTYFKLNESGQLKINKPVSESNETKLDGAALKLELGSIYDSLISQQKRCNIALNEKQENKSFNSMTSEEVSTILLGYGASPTHIAQLCADPAKFKIAQSASGQLKNFQEQLSRVNDQKKSLELFNGGQQFCGALAQAGMLSDSPALIRSDVIGRFTYASMYQC